MFRRTKHIKDPGNVETWKVVFDDPLVKICSFQLIADFSNCRFRFQRCLFKLTQSFVTASTWEPPHSSPSTAMLTPEEWNNGRPWTTSSLPISARFATCQMLSLDKRRSPSKEELPPAMRHTSHWGRSKRIQCGAPVHPTRTGDTVSHVQTTSRVVL